MKFYLWWWWSADKDWALEDMHKLIWIILKRENIKQVLHFPFARTWVRKKNRDWFSPQNFSAYLETIWVEYLCWYHYEDIAKFSWEAIYINWWNDTNYLMEMSLNTDLREAIEKSNVIIWESAWAMIFWDYFRSSLWGSWIKWLWLIEKTIIEPHFKERNNAENLQDWMNQHIWLKGLWIDETTFVAHESWEFWDKFWFGWVYHI
jgi:hypothetical protein